MVANPNHPDHFHYYGLSPCAIQEKIKEAKQELSRKREEIEAKKREREEANKRMIEEIFKNR